MIAITDHRGMKQLVSLQAIATVKEAGASSQWHGIRSIVKLFDGSIIESSESITDLQRKIEGW